MKHIVMPIVIFGLLKAFSHGQGDGITTFGASDAHGVDAINLITLAPVINIPVVPGVVLTSGQSCGITALLSTLSCMPTSYFQPYLSSMLGHIGWSNSIITCPDGQQWSVNNNYVYYSADGLDAHPLTPSLYTYEGTGDSSCATTISNALTQDNSGYSISLNNLLNGTIVAADGTTATISAGYVLSQQDTFGNTLTASAWGQNSPETVTTYLGSSTQLYFPLDTHNIVPYVRWTDTTGHTQQLVFVLASNTGASLSYQSCATHENNPGTYPIQQIQFPDNTSMVFTMEQGTSQGYITGRIGSFT